MYSLAISTTTALALLSTAARAIPLSKRTTAVCYTGAQFPDSSQWLDFSTLFSTAKTQMQTYNSPDEISALQDAVKSVSKSAGLDPRVVLTMIMQESGGNVRIRTGDQGRSPGLMQIHGGSDCLSSSWGTCPHDTISKMVSQGVDGTGSSGSQGLKKCYAQNGNSYPLALRCYNSGTVQNRNDLSQGLGTASYVSDVGNRLRGVDPYAQGTPDCLGNHEIQQ